MDTMDIAIAAIACNTGMLDFVNLFFCKSMAILQYTHPWTHPWTCIQPGTGMNLCLCVAWLGGCLATSIELVHKEFKVWPPCIFDTLSDTTRLSCNEPTRNKPRGWCGLMTKKTTNRQKNCELCGSIFVWRYSFPCVLFW